MRSNSKTLIIPRCKLGPDWESFFNQQSIPWKMIAQVEAKLGRRQNRMRFGKSE